MWVAWQELICPTYSNLDSHELSLTYQIFGLETDQRNTSKFWKMEEFATKVDALQIQRREIMKALQGMNTRQ